LPEKFHFEGLLTQRGGRQAGEKFWSKNQEKALEEGPWDQLPKGSMWTPLSAAGIEKQKG
jgi:hypothetical protein